MQHAIWERQGSSDSVLEKEKVGQLPTKSTERMNTSKVQVRKHELRNVYMEHAYFAGALTSENKLSERPPARLAAY